jgi:quinohemoprotein ethanol dehydrogenase
MRRSAWLTAAALVAFGLSGHLPARDAGPDSAARLADGNPGQDWAGYGGTYGEQHFSPLTQINDKSVGQLGLAWSIDLAPGNSVTTPLAVAGVLYYTTNFSVVHAVDAVTGKKLWTFDPKAPEASGFKLRQGWGSRGIAWWNGKIYTGTHDGRLIAIDAKTGKQLWSAQTYGADDSRYITGAPRVFDGKVIIGHGGGDVGAIRGYVTTYDAETGKQLWRWYTVPGNPADGFENEAMEKAAKTWFGEWWKYGGGGTVWNAMTYDAETDTILLGTGNGTPWNHKARSQGKGDNLYLCSIVALDAKTGRYKWHYQVNPGETWDYNAAMDIELADLMIDGKPRKVAMTAPKNGFLYVIDRLTGKLISAKPYVKVTWATGIDENGRPIEHPNARYLNGTTFELWPSPTGSHSWQAMAFSPKTGLVYIPAIEKGSLWHDTPDTADDKWLKTTPIMGMRAAAAMDYRFGLSPNDGTTALIAWDPVKQKEVWRHPNEGLVSSAILATGGNLVFQGGLNGNFRAHAADSGKELWSFAAQAPVIAAPISYSVGGRQYVTVLTGSGLSAGLAGGQLRPFNIDYRAQKRRVLTFVLGGKAKLPPVEPFTLTASDDPDFKPDAAAAGRGAVTFAYRCVICHGTDAIAAGTAPDLRTSPIPVSAEAFTSVVHEGALIPNGMPRFEELTSAELADVRQYLRTRAADLRSGKDK